jgi:hypothetical protein
MSKNHIIGKPEARA